MHYFILGLKFLATGVARAALEKTFLGYFYPNVPQSTLGFKVQKLCGGGTPF